MNFVFRKDEFCFISAAIRKWKFSPLNLLASNHVTNTELLCVSSLTQMPPNRFIITLISLTIIVAHITIFFNFLEDFIDIFHNRSTRTKCIFDIKISISKSTKAIHCCLSS